MPPAMCGMERLHPPVQHFRELRDLSHFPERRDARVFQHAKGAAGGENLDAQRRQCSGEADDTGLIGDAQESASNARHGIFLWT